MDDGTGMESPPANLTTSAVPRACDACRARKIRCNRETPCAHCLQAKIECSTNLETRAKEKRARILLTPQYERKIDHLDRRLDGVVRLLEDLKTQLTPGLQSPAKGLSPAPTAPNTAKFTSPVSSPASHRSHADTGTVVEGDSSLAAHSIFANDLLRKVVDQDSSLKMRETLDTLRHLVDSMKQQPAAHETAYPNAKTIPSYVTAALKGCELPPIQKTVHILKLAKPERFSPMVWIYEAFPIHMFPETCMRVYFSDDYTVTDFIIVNAGLHTLFWAYVYLYSPSDADEYKQFSHLCAGNLETALASLPLHLPATIDYIMALLSGAFYAIELSKPSLAWILTAKASELCQTLGYHRVETYKNERLEDVRHKQFLFWSLYTLEKGLCLRLGRSSTIQDYDISVPYPTTNDPHRLPICAYVRLWARTAQAQGQVYERLYSPEAIAQSEGIRRSRVQALVQSLEDLESLAVETIERFETWCKEVAGPDVTRFFNAADHVLRLSLLTTIHRAVPNPAGSLTTFSPECIRAARATLDLHQDCMAVNEKGNLGLFSTYMNWTILFAPFVPFLVLFCQVIETRDRTDLGRLQAFVTSISRSSLDQERSPDQESEATIKLRRLFEVLCTIASHYLDNLHSTRGRPTTSNGDETVHGHGTMSDGIDAYLATLGFPPHGIVEHQVQTGEYLESNPAIEMSGYGDDTHRGVNPMLWMGNGTQLEDWFFSNQQMMEFLEDGSSGIN